jgi:hypothetical protein
MQDDVEGNVFVRESNGTKHPLGVIHIDIAHDGKAKQPHGLLPMHYEYNAGIPRLLELRDLARAHRIHHALPQHGLQRRQHEEQPEEIEHGHVSAP